MAEYTWIRITLVRQTDKTSVWAVEAKLTGAELGIIKWAGTWRRYCFFPNSGTQYDAGCLYDIYSFCKAEMDKRRRG